MLGLDRTLSPDTPFLHFSVRGLKSVMHRHTCYELVYAHRGSIPVWVAGREETLPEGSFALLLPGMLHSYDAAEDSVADLWLWRPELLPDLGMLIADRQPLHAVFSLPEADAVALLKGLTDAEAAPSLCVPERPRKKSHRRAPVTLPADLLALRGTLYSALAQYFRGMPMVQKSSQLLLLEEVVAYVEEGYKYPISMTLLADKIGYERHYLSRFFRASVHMHFTTYVDSYRIEEAMDLLRRTGLPMATVARHCGFGSVRTFDRVFLQLVGQTPSAFKEAAKKQPPTAD